MNTLSVLGKYLDQPKLVNKFSQAVPSILIAGGGLYALNNAYQSPKNKRKKRFVKDIAVLTGTIGGALMAPKIAKKILKGHLHGDGHSHASSSLIDHFIKENHVDENIAGILNKAKDKVLKFGEIKTAFEALGKNKKGQEFLDKLVPNPEEVDSKHIFGEIGMLSIYGAIPVLGGIGGGIVGDKITENNWKKNVPNKIKEGTYQYLANIFLCNIGAGAALLAMEKANVKSKAVRAAGMVGGIILTGIVLGSAIANIIGEKIIEPMLGFKHDCGIYHERKPEAIDMGLHIDDVATVAVLSGLKWIVPALPILYSVSGYRAGIGYRNGEDKYHHHHRH